MTSDVITTQPHSWVDTPPQNPPLRNMSAKLLTRMPWLDKLSSPLQRWIAPLYGQPGQSSYKVKDMLNGVWLGHTLHPVFVTVPLGAWTTTMLLDLTWLSDQSEGTARSADMTMWLGLAGAGASAITGVTNWVDTDGPEQRTGMLHALLNSGVTVLNLTSALMRLGGLRRTAITLSSTAYLVSLYSAYLGGELSYSSGVGVNHVAWEGGSDDFVPVINEQDLIPGKLTRVDVAGMPAVLLKDGGSIYAIAATCSHLGGPLDEGHCEEGIVYCPWHGSGFHMSDGSVANSPAVYAQPTFEIRTRQEKIELRRREHA